VPKRECSSPHPRSLRVGPKAEKSATTAISGAAGNRRGCRIHPAPSRAQYRNERHSAAHKDCTPQRSDSESPQPVNLGGFFFFKKRACGYDSPCNLEHLLHFVKICPIRPSQSDLDLSAFTGACLFTRLPCPLTTPRRDVAWRWAQKSISSYVVS